MSQNRLGLAWSREEVTERLRVIMLNIYNASKVRLPPTSLHAPQWAFHPSEYSVHLFPVRTWLPHARLLRAERNCTPRPPSCKLPAPRRSSSGV